ncbi:MAG: phosphate/phosphite/phosphonate ABC transporter substrate-binding protein [Chloroflexi bacterium]|nr:phosphate/phosphite/phosphonate ABC transporter substrate-binding protein [Chloroflexota bacterium]
MKNHAHTAFLLFATLLISSCAPATPTPLSVPTPISPPAACAKLPSAFTPAAGGLGSPDKPLTIAFVPAGDTGLITRAGTTLADCLTNMTSLTYKVEVGTSYSVSIESMGGGKAQIGFLNTFSVLLAQEKYGIETVLVNLRTDATSGKLQDYYQGQFIANKAAGIKKIVDLKGKTFCFADPSSTSGTIIPRIVLKANGIDPDKDFKATQFAGSHNNVAIAVYKGDCDAGATYVDVRTVPNVGLQKTFPDILDKTEAFFITDSIPNDGVQYIKGLDKKIKDLTTEALLAIAANPGANDFLRKLYSIEGFTKITNDYYKPFGDVLKKAGIDPATLVK